MDFCNERIGKIFIARLSGNYVIGGSHTRCRVNKDVPWVFLFIGVYL